jgi:hypothetical protein
MSTLKHFRIRRQDQDSWNYIVEITDDRGASMQFNASFDDLDRMAFEIEEQVAVLVAAAEKKGMSA